LPSLWVPIGFEFVLYSDVEDDDGGDDDPIDGEEGGASVSLDGPSNSSYFTIPFLLDPVFAL
jgi:hypothetical protein